MKWISYFTPRSINSFVSSIFLFFIHFFINLTQVIVLIIHLLRKEINQKGVLQRFAILLPQGKFDMWIHCASLGEAKVLVCLAQSLLKLNPKLKLIISVQRSSAKKYIKKELQAVEIFYFPLDALWVWKIFFKQVQVKKLICIESEIWPKLFLHKARFNLNIILVNARISTKSFDFFRRLKFIFKEVFDAIDEVYAQNDDYSKRFNRLGTRIENIKITGNLKYDLFASQKNFLQKGESLFKTVLFVSTREGEEERIKKILTPINKSQQDIRFIIAPRHQTRFKKVYQLFKESGIKKFTTDGINHPLVLVDYYGKLNEIYPLCDAVVVGGTLEDFGGHSIIEPASFACAILVGSFTDHIFDDVELFINNNALIQVSTKNNNDDELEQALIELLADYQLREALRNNAFNVVKSQRGSSKRIAHALIDSQSGQLES